MAVADTEHGNAERVDPRVDRGTGGLDHAGRSARDDDPARTGKRRGRGVDVADGSVHAQLADPARDQVAVLTTRVEDDDLAHGRRGLTAAAPASGPAERPCPPS